MSFFNTILEKLGIRKDQPASTAPASTTKTVVDKGERDSSPIANKPVTTTSPLQAVSATVSAAKVTPIAVSDVDVVKKLEKLSAGSGLDWKVSIVDLLKLLDIDSSREARNELAKELGCPAELMSDSAKMNVWLHKTVLKKIAENGGNIPQSLFS